MESAVSCVDFFDESHFVMLQRTFLLNIAFAPSTHGVSERMTRNVDSYPVGFHCEQF